MLPRKRLPFSGTIGANRPLKPEETVYHCTYSCSCKLHPAFQGSTLMPGGQSWELSSTRPAKMGTDVVKSMLVGAWPRLNLLPCTQVGMSSPQVGSSWKFHEYLYGSTFDMYIDNNPLTYIHMMAKLDTASHWWVASLANYNFWLSYWARKTNIDADALSLVSWPGCVPDNLGTHLKATAAAVQGCARCCPQRPHKPHKGIQLWSVQDSQQVTCMTLEDWHWAQQVDPTLHLVISRLQDGTLGWWQSKQTDPPEFNQFLQEHNHLLLQKGVLYRRARPRESEETFFQLVLLPAHREVTLKGCHDEVSHLGLKHMLDLMCDQFIWPHMLSRWRNTLMSVIHALPSRPSSPKPLWKIL